jgi:DNA-binding response OmpR family regulator
MAGTVLLVVDEPNLRDLVGSCLKRAGFTVLSAEAGAEAISMATPRAPDLVVVDLGLAGVPGETAARQLRVAGPVPILMLTAGTSVPGRTGRPEHGAGDYVTKPFSPRELVACVQAILLRGGPGAGPGAARYGGGTLVIDKPRRQVMVRGTGVGLTPTEWGVLVALATVPGRVYSRFELINRVRGRRFEGDQRTIDSHVKNLRRKIEEDPGNPQIIQTVVGGGYRLGLPRDD